MAYPGYLSVGGNEIVNDSRAAAYMAAAGIDLMCKPCPDLPALIGDETYWSVVNDPAPWFDPAVPESSRFYGVIGLGVAGLSDSGVTRTPTPLVGGGAAIGQRNRGHREIVWTMLLVAADECALLYGANYLDQALAGSECATSSCAGDTACFFACCPGDDGGPLPTSCETGLPPFMPLDDSDKLRTLFDVGVLNGLTRNAIADNGNYVTAEYAVTLVAGNPYIYTDELPAFPSTWYDLPSGLRITNYDPEAVTEACPSPADCTEDPSCPRPELPPRPPVPVGPCYPTGPANFRRTVAPLRAIDDPNWLTTVPVITVRTGMAEMRRLVVRFWSNPTSSTGCDIDRLDPCSACLDLVVPYVPGNSQLTIDGRLKRAEIACKDPGGAGLSYREAQLYGPKGSRVTWPELTCSSGLCIEILTLESATAQGSKARVALHNRMAIG